MSEGSQSFQTANPRNDHENYFLDVSVKHEGKTFELSEGFGVKHGSKDMVVVGIYCRDNALEIMAMELKVFLVWWLNSFEIHQRNNCQQFSLHTIHENA